MIRVNDSTESSSEHREEIFLFVFDVKLEWHVYIQGSVILC
jgi:hypothetical protein